MFGVFKQYLSVKNVLFFILAILTLIFITKIKDVVIMFFASYVIACSLNPMVDKLEKYMKRSVAASLVLGASIIVVLMFFVPVFYIVGHQIKSFLMNFPLYMNHLYLFIQKNSLLSSAILTKTAFGSLLSSSVNITTAVVNSSIEVGMNIASRFVYLIAACLIIYYFMADISLVKKCYISLFPFQMKSKAGEILDVISKKIGGYIVALIATIACVGVIMTTGLMMLKVDYALLLGLMTAILDIIPVIGPGIALIIALIVCFKYGWVTLALIVLVFSIAQLVENNLVRPLVFGKLLDIHPLIIYFFLFITAQYLGVVGVIFAPAIAATVCVLVEELYIKNIN